MDNTLSFNEIDFRCVLKEEQRNKEGEWDLTFKESKITSNSQIINFKVSLIGDLIKESVSSGLELIDLRHFSRIDITIK